VPKQDLCDDGARCALSAIPDLLQRIDCPFEIDFQALSDRLADVPDEANGLLKLLDGQRTLREALAAAEDAGQAAAAARDLSALGVIRPVPGAAPAAPDDSGAGGSPVERANGLEARAAASASDEGSPPASLRVVRFPSRRKRLPPPPGRLGGRRSGASNGERRDGAGPRWGAAGGSIQRLPPEDGWAGGDHPARRAPNGGEGRTSGWRRRAAAILIAGALAVVTASAFVFMHRRARRAAEPGEGPAPAAEVPDAGPGDSPPP
jgi:hypothetical protein